ncbi:MAG: PstS family phosphate ABC transporter substrate-binding protein [Phycisphaeraceae bacterium]|nr:PstS family phosphate ABC transporter substrate-binding protein [Phycisphaeraceae bacterium]
MFQRTVLTAAAISLASLSVAQGQSADLSRLKGAVRIDGSSTVYPITEAVAEEFGKEASDVRVTVGISGTGGGFKRFVVGETDISDASRPIKAAEYKAAQDNGIEFIELPVAYDGLSIVVNHDNTWADQLTVDELKKIFLDTESKAMTWADVRAGWPDVAIKIYAPGTDSGTFDYFKEVVAEEGSIRGDMSVSEDDNVLVRGVAGDRGAIGFFGCAYYFENKESLRAVPIVNSDGKAVGPTPETIENGTYNPFSRPLFIYVNAESKNRPEVNAFVEFYFEQGPDLADEVGYVRLPESVYDRARNNFHNNRTGTQFLDAEGNKVSGPVTEVYQ